MDMADDKFKDDDEVMVEKRVIITVGENDGVTDKDRLLAKRKEVAKKGISITRALISFGYENWIALEPGSILVYLYNIQCDSRYIKLCLVANYYIRFRLVEKRNDAKYVKGELTAALNKELEWIEEKNKIEKEANAIMGKDLASKFTDMHITRNEAYGSG